MASVILLCALAVQYAPGQALAHDASAYGGVFRSRGMGGAWLNADVGLFLNAPLTVAVDPRDPNHLLMGTDVGLYASVNGGRGWTREAPSLINGAVFAVTISPDGATMLCVAPDGVYRYTGDRWMRSNAPREAMPARAIIFGQTHEQIYLLGQDRLFRSSDDGLHFVSMPDDPGTPAAIETLAMLRLPRQVLFVIAHGRLSASIDGGNHWQQRSVIEGNAPIDMVSPDPAVPNRVWVATADRVHVSDDGGLRWRPVGATLPEAHTTVRGIAADPAITTLVVTTHRGTYRGTDAGAHWMLEEGNLPLHLEAGPLFRDPTDPRVLYAVYSLVPYPEVWRNALEGSNLLSRVDPVSLIGGVAFLILLLLSGVLVAVWLTRWRRDVPGIAR